MERALRQTLAGRALAAALLAGALALAWAQRRSPLFRALAEGKPILGWLDLRGPGRSPELFLLVYQPGRRSLDLFYWPGSLPAAEASLGAWVPGAGIGSGLPVWSAQSPEASEEPPLDAADWVARSARQPRAWLRVAGGQSKPWFDRLLLALELQVLRPQDLHPAWLPPEDQAPALLERIILGAPAAPPERITVEVLNASQQPGVASRAKNLLRLRGADVMSVGNVGHSPRTLVYDRTGNFAAASAVARMLGCPQARALTQVDLKRLVDVSVVLAGDCAL